MPAVLDDLRDIEGRAKSELEAVADEAALEAWRVAYLGRKGRLTLVLRGLASLPAEERRQVGAAANRLKGLLEDHLRVDRGVLAGSIFPGSADVGPMAGLVG